MSFVFLFSNSGCNLAKAPNSVVQTGVKSSGWENKMAQESPMNSWKEIRPLEVSAVKSGAVEPNLKVDDIEEE